MRHVDCSLATTNATYLRSPRGAVQRGEHMTSRHALRLACFVAGLGFGCSTPGSDMTSAPDNAPHTARDTLKKPPNILMIMGDDVGWFNIGAYHQGIMAGKTPNLDKLAAEGMRFTDYYAEASCTAGRANFITGELPLRTGMTTVGQAGANVGIPDEAGTLAT